mgnify:CR=1 FL=1
MMPVPGHWQLNGYDYPHYNDAIALFPILDDPGIQADNPTGVYRYTFQEEKQKDREYILRFDGVESAYHVWLNGTFIGYSQGPRNTAEFDVTEALQDGENVLAVIVYKFSDGSYLENTQLEPDIKVANSPETVVKGEDTQLKMAVDELLKEIDSRKK